MATSASSSTATWGFPEDLKHEHSSSFYEESSSMPGSFYYKLKPDPESKAQSTQSKASSPSDSKASSNPKKKQRHWKPRQCRICLEVIQPWYRTASGNLSDIFEPAPQAEYISEDPSAGKLIRPCKCKGSSKYVHEGCLQAWRHADPSYGKRNYWSCPTCGFRYRLERMAWGRAISNTGTQLLLTLFIFFLAMFILGFVADPIINLYLDPYNTISSGSSLGGKLEPLLTDDETPTWLEHFLKGMASLGLLGFVKMLLALSPYHLWNLRSTGILSSGSRAGTNGRDRMGNVFWIGVLIGIGTFLWGVYRGVRVWSRRMLDRASERVVDVPQAENDDDDDD
ncbi:hypothetical protein MMC25_006778 [Agyrium rufum]|nr:hypothetical protein [Agyrium rufum]